MDAPGAYKTTAPTERWVSVDVGVTRAGLAMVAALAMGSALGVFGVVPVALAAAGLVLLLAAARWPEKAVLAVPLAVYLPARQALGEAVNVGAADVMLGVLLFGWLFWATSQRTLRLERDVVWLLLIMLVGGAALSMANSPEPKTAVFGVVRTIELWFLLFVVVLSCVRSSKAMAWLLQGFVVVALLEAGVGIYQFVSGTGAYVGGSYTRAFGTIGPYSWLDLAIALGAALCLVAGDLLARPRAGAGRYLALAALVAAVLATYSRGVWLALLVALLCMALIEKPRVLVVLICAVLLLVAVVTANPQTDLARRVVSISDPNDPSVVQRLILWRTAANMFAAQPLLGWGPKSFPVLRDRFAAPGLEVYSYHDTLGGSLKVELLSPHNFYLFMAAERGIIGLATFLALMTLLVFRCARAACDRRSPELASVALGCTGALLFLAIHSIAGDHFFGSSAPVAAFFMASGAAIGQIHAHARASDEAALALSASGTAGVGRDALNLFQ